MNKLKNGPELRWTWVTRKEMKEKPSESFEKK
jgi:hypothetical protein